MSQEPTPHTDRLDAPTTSEALATFVSDRSSRRGFLFRAGAIACSAVGVTIAASSIVEGGSARGACQHDDDCTATGLWGGMGGTGCKGYKNCAGCLGPNGCPNGSTVGQYWEVCVRCKNDTSQGQIFKYWDCCGGPLDSACNGCGSGPNCNNNAGCQIRLWCSGSYVCTFWENTKEVCPVTNTPSPIGKTWSFAALAASMVALGASTLVGGRRSRTRSSS